MVRLLIASTADYANIAQGNKLNLMGVFDTIYSPTFSYRHPSIVLALRLQFEFEDYRDQPHVLDVALVDQDGRKLLTATGHITAPQLKPGQRVTVNQLLVFGNTEFQRPDDYTFMITWDSDEIQRVPLSVVKAEPPETQQQQKEQQ